MLSPHPPQINLPTALNPLRCTRRGLCPINRQVLHQTPSTPRRRIYYELHGSINALHKLVLIMGLNNTCFAWSRQIDHFAQKPDHAVLVFDNRGVGYSETGPFEIYKTSEMAKDVVELLDHLSWNHHRSLHIVGVSMGGMITQELCLLIPNRIISVVLTSTKARDIHLPPIKTLYTIAKMNITRASQEERVSALVKIMFPVEFLAASAKEDTKESIKTVTNRAREEFTMGSHHRLMRPQTPMGEFGQLGASLLHSCSPDALARMGEMLKPAKVLVLGGDRDELIHVSKTIELHCEIPNSELVIIKGGGHALCAQMEEEHNLIIERVMREGLEAISALTPGP